jgi:hypothetical protein
VDDKRTPCAGGRSAQSSDTSGIWAAAGRVWTSAASKAAVTQWVERGVKVGFPVLGTEDALASYNGPVADAQADAVARA